MRLHERVEVAKDMRAGVGGLLGVVLVVDALVGATAATGGEMEAATADGILQRIASGQIVEQHRQQQPHGHHHAPHLRGCPHLLPLNRWAVVNPSAITNIELQPKPVATMADGGG